MLRFQQSAYTFKFNGFVCDYLRRIHYNDDNIRAIEREQYQRSLQIEPRQSQELKHNQVHEDDNDDEVDGDSSPSMLASVNAKVVLWVYLLACILWICCAEAYLSACLL